MLALGLTELEGEILVDEEGDKLNDSLKLTLELGETLEEGLRDGLFELEGLTEALGDLDPLGLRLEDGETEALGLELIEEEGDAEADGDRDTPKLCIQISQFSLVKPVTFLYSYISPSTLPVGCGPIRTKDGLGRITPSCSKYTLPALVRPLIGVRPLS